MAYSCSDFTDDVLNTLISIGLIDCDAIADNDPQAQAEVAMRAIADLARNATVCEGIRDATLFFKELQGSSGTSLDLADIHGAGTMAKLLSWQNSIMSDTPVNLLQTDVADFAFVRSLPSGERWWKRVHVLD